MKTIRTLLFAAIAACAGLAAFIYSGSYPVGADVRHTAFTHWALETLRDRSIDRAAASIEVPALDDPELLLMGGPDYNDMCTGCHLKPGLEESDLSVGLYPAPPDLTEKAADPRRQFWVIKHGIKASGMPAWGPTHDDQRIWAMVAFLQKLPDLNAQQYQILTARDDDDAGDHH
ncbi:c-type cytochrome [Microbulbifer taiwanensis]|uniref:C-type cytochrome n=1 Tax=Microbulbifer taiwanensis TaxID=986746 RepID=A0ABW1YKQ8_9GAMM|nr:cytochrome c [Microbulbifer taiwanensis]